MIALLAGVLSILNSCYFCWLEADTFTYRYDGKLTGIDSLINVDGYYETNTYYMANANIMFYRDGTLASVFGTAGMGRIKSDTDSIGNIDGWGQYKICGDTIKTQTIVIAGNIFWGDSFASSPIIVFERWFKIINRDTLLVIYYNDIKEPKRTDKQYFNTLVCFKPLKSRPDSNCWLKRNSWAWKDGKILE